MLAVQIPDGFIPSVHLAAAAQKLRARPKESPFHRLPLYPKQAAIVDDPARFTICEATTKAGKTMSHIEWLLDEGIRTGEGEWLWAAPIYRQAEVAFRRSCNRLRGLIEKPDGDSFRMVRVADPIPFRHNKTGLSIECNGARFVYASAEKPDNLYGEDTRGVVGDEISRWREDSWVAVYSTLAATKGRAKLIGNVKGRKNWSYKLARKAEAGERDWSYHKLTASDAVDGGILDAEIVEQARRHLTDEVFRQLFMAEAGDDEGNPFGLAAIEACIHKAGLGPGPAVSWGWDLAKSVDWTVGIALNKLGQVCEFHRFQRSWDDTESEIVRLSGPVPGIVDSTGVGDPIMERLAKRTNLVGMKYTSQSKQQLMEGLAVALQTSEVAYPDGPIRHELEAFEYEYTRTGVRYSAPAGMHDDCVCALAQSVSAFVSMPKAFEPRPEQFAGIEIPETSWQEEVAW